MSKNGSKSKISEAHLYLNTALSQILDLKDKINKIEEFVYDSIKALEFIE